MRRAKALHDIVKPELREPTAGEAAAIAKARQRNAERPARPSLAVTTTGTAAITISNQHTDRKGWFDHLADVVGTNSEDFLNEVIQRLGGAVATRVGDERHVTARQGELNAALALMGAIAPKDELEAALGEQIIAAHIASMDFMRRARANAGENRHTSEAYTNMATKVSRTMATHVETLTKLRTGGKQRIEVIYVNGPAVIGDHAQTVIGAEGQGEARRISAQPLGPDHFASLEAAPGVPMPGQDAARDALPITSNPGAEAVQDSRRKEPGSADREGERPLSDVPSHPRATGSPPARARRRQGRADA